MRTYMGTKTISIMDDAYNLLKNERQKGESFSEVIRRITRKQKDIMKFAGVWKDLFDQDIEKMKKDIILLRKKATKDLRKRLKRIDNKT